jgi:flavin-dependent dehydrogenase
VVVNREDAWTWVIPFSDGTTSVGVVGSPEFLAKHGSEPDRALRSVLEATPQLSNRLGEIEFLFEPRTIDGYSVGVDRLHGPNYCLVGNTTEFLDPVCFSIPCSPLA